MKTAIVVGSGAGGATVAKELQGAFDVTVMEEGNAFRRLPFQLSTMEKWKKTGLLFDEREIPLVFPHMQIRKTPDMVLVNGIGLGGTTTICTGNALRMDQDLQELGIDLNVEFEEIAREIPISTAHQAGWNATTRRLFDICRAMDLDPQPMPKMGDYERSVHCGRCIFGCPLGVKRDIRRFLSCRVERVVVDDGRATGVEARHGWSRRYHPADLVVLAAGGLGTPPILQSSGISCESHLFVDPVLCVAAPSPGARQCFEVEMPFVVQRERFILSPYFDPLSFLFNRSWRYPATDIVGLMIKLADSTTGDITRDGVRKTLTAEDRTRLAAGVELSDAILQEFGVEPGSTFLGTINAGHPGGSLPLTRREANSFHHARLPANLYVADATLIPKALGNPPILTIIAIAKRVSRLCAEEWA
jgi:choline dehydrogenase-like flavoprotein